MLAPGIHARKRIVALLFLFALAMAALTGRLAYWQFYRGAELAEKGREIRAWETRIASQRGPLVDRNGYVLAENLTSWSIFANPREVPDKAGAAATLARILGQPAESILKNLNQNRSYVYIQRKVTDQQAEQVRALRAAGQLKGIEMEPEAKRYYPEGELAAHLLGFTGIDNQGLAGLEAWYDEQLRGKPGAIKSEHDARGRLIAGGEKKVTEPTPGLTAVLCLDKALQLRLEQGAQTALEYTRARRVGLAVMDVKTGCILAMVSRPSFDPNVFRPATADDWNKVRMWLVSDSIHPGSIFKPVTAAAALEEGVVTVTTPMDVPGCKQFQPNTKPICNWDDRGLGRVTLVEVMRESSNVGFATLGSMVGVDRFYRYLDLFNLRTRTGLDFPGEARGDQVAPEWAKKYHRDFVTQAFGQTLTVSPIQMLAALNAIANDGVWVQPHLLKEFRDDKGQVALAFQPNQRPIISKETAREIQELMVGVVTGGTGKGAQIPGYRVGGKTGTAEKTVNGVLLDNIYTASFVGIAPIPDPRVTVLVSIDEAQGALRMGGQIAAPLFGQIMGDVLRYLQVPPELPAPRTPARGAPPPREVKVPDLANLPLEKARAAAKAALLEVSVEGAGPVVTGQFPPPGATVAPGTVVRIQALPPGESGMDIKVPDLRGLTLRQAADLLESLGIRYRTDGSGAVVRQDPAPGVAVPQSTRVQIWLQPLKPAP